MDIEADFDRWLKTQAASVDPFDHVRAAGVAHRQDHGSSCTVYPTSKAPLYGVLAGATQARRILEIGCGVGYSALWLAHGAAGARVTTVEADPLHAEIARGMIRDEAYADRIEVVTSRGLEFLATYQNQLDLIFCDCDVEEYPAYPAHSMRLLRPGGLLITANLFAGWYSPDMPGLEAAVAYRDQILGDTRLLTAFLGSNAVSLRVS